MTLSVSPPLTDSCVCGWLSGPQHESLMAVLELADVMLDTFPWGAGITSLEVSQSLPICTCFRPWVSKARDI